MCAFVRACVPYACKLSRLVCCARSRKRRKGEGGLRVLDAAYLARARELCDVTGTVLIHDEVQCGCGRTGTFLAAQAAGVTPDVATLAKPLGGGLQRCLRASDSIQPVTSGASSKGPANWKGATAATGCQERNVRAARTDRPNC